MAAHNDELLKLRELIGMLGERIAPVLGPDHPEKLLGPTGDSPERSEVGRIIDEQTCMVRYMHRQISDLTLRVEL